MCEKQILVMPSLVLKLDLDIATYFIDFPQCPIMCLVNMFITVKRAIFYLY